ncbi:hypothetical protein GCM10027432_14260 [Lysobacter fragariae]
MAVRLAPTMTTSLMGSSKWGRRGAGISRLCGGLLQCGKRPDAWGLGLVAERVGCVRLWRDRLRR